jgi:hypothetical protein
MIRQRDILNEKISMKSLGLAPGAPLSLVWRGESAALI